jgi:hypothetical protein
MLAFASMTHISQNVSVLLDLFLSSGEGTGDILRLFRQKDLSRDWG